MAVAPSAGGSVGEKWTGGLKDMHLDCPVGVLWDFISDWAHWDRFYPSSPDFPMVSQLREGENRKVGCLRYAEVAPKQWTTERLLALDNAKYYFSYNMEENVFCGGLRNYVAKVQFRGTTDDKTVLEHWSYEVDPLTNMSREDFTKFIQGFLSMKLIKGVEAASKKVAAERWTGGVKAPMLIDCDLDILWDLCSDWGHWDRFYPSDANFKFQTELKEGQNRQVGCMRFAEVSEGVWTNERLVAIDNASHSLSYNMEENKFCGGLRNYVAKVQFSATKDGKTQLEYWNFVVEPLTTMTREEFTAFLGGFLVNKLVKGLESAAQKLAAGNASKTKATTTGSTPATPPGGHPQRHGRHHFFGHKD